MRQLYSNTQLPNHLCVPMRSWILLPDLTSLFPFTTLSFTTFISISPSHSSRCTNSKCILLCVSTYHKISYIYLNRILQAFNSLFLYSFLATNPSFVQLYPSDNVVYPWLPHPTQVLSLCVYPLAFIFTSSRVHDHLPLSPLVFPLCVLESYTKVIPLTISFFNFFLCVYPRSW